MKQDSIENGVSPLGRYSEDAIATEFAAKHAGDIRYTAARGWFQLDGADWWQIPPEVAGEMCRELCREFAQKAAQDEDLSAARRLSISATLRKYSTVMAVAKFVRGDLSEQAVASHRLNMAAAKNT